MTPQDEESVLPTYETKSQVIDTGLNLEFVKLQSTPPYDTRITTSLF